jgi:hypothetical protein
VKQIKVNCAQLLKIRNCVVNEAGIRWAEAVYNGFKGFLGSFGGIDITRNGWGLRLVDTGITGPDGYRSNTTEFYVPTKGRARRKGPLA